MVLSPEHPLVDRDHHAGAASGGRRRTSEAAPQERLRAHRAGQDEDRRVHRGVRDQPGERRARSRSGSPTTCWRATAPGRSWPCPATTSATSSSPSSSTCRSSRSCSRRDEWLKKTEQHAGQPDGAVLSRRASRSTPARSTACRRRGEGEDHRLAGGAAASARGGSTTSCATGCSAGSATGASRSRSCTSRRTATDRRHRRCRRASCRCVLPDLEDFKPTGTPEPPLAKATDWVNVDARRQALPARDEHDAAVGRVVLVLPALHRPEERRGVLRPGEAEVLAAGRPVRRRGGARGAAPAVLAVLAQGAVRPRPRPHARSRSSGWSTRG